MAQFVYGSKSNVPDYVRRGGATYRVVSDHLGSPRYVVNVANAGDVPFTANYSAFGSVTGTGLDWMPFGFAGGIYDPDTQLTRFGARDYDPSVGRWTSKDPIRFGGHQANLYAYGHSDPVNTRDPRGLSVLLCRRVADLPGNSFFQFEHHFIATGGVAAGAGVCGGGVPGHGNKDLPFDPMCMNDHSGELSRADVVCEEVYADEDCVAGALGLGQQLGPWAPPINDCHTVAADIIAACSVGTWFPYGGAEGAPNSPSQGGSLGY